MLQVLTRRWPNCVGRHTHCGTSTAVSTCHVHRNPTSVLPSKLPLLVSIVSLHKPALSWNYGVYPFCTCVCQHSKTKSTGRVITILGLCIVPDIPTFPLLAEFYQFLGVFLPFCTGSTKSRVFTLRQFYV